MALKILKIANIAASFLLLALVCLAFGFGYVSLWTIALLLMPGILIVDTALLNTPAPDRRNTWPHTAWAIWSVANIIAGVGGLVELSQGRAGPQIVAAMAAVFFLLALLSGVALMLHINPHDKPDSEKSH